MTRLKTIFLRLCCITWLTAGAPAVAGTPALLQATLKNTTCEGRLVGRDDDVCWLMGRDGRLFRIKINSIRKIESIAPKFRKYSSAELRDRLRREYGKDVEVVGTGHYLVCGPRSSAAQYASVFERIYRDVHLYFSRRGFRIEEPEFPLVAVVFPDRTSFFAQCRKDEVRPSPGLLGYYHPDTNRVALFDASSELSADTNNRLPQLPSFEEIFSQTAYDSEASRFVDVTAHPRREIAAAGGGPLSATDHPVLEDVMRHEAIHQVAFNIGLHTRIGENPKWIVEGLATALEVPGMHVSAPTDTTIDRANHYRLVWFQKYANSRRKPTSLADFVARDDLYLSAAPDAYSEGWALTFFLLETRAGKFAGYLRTVAGRDPKLAYSADDRLADFRAAFGENLDLLEAEFLRFIDRLR